MHSTRGDGNTLHPGTDTSGLVLMSPSSAELSGKGRTNLQSLVGSTEKHHKGEQSAVLSLPDRATWGSATTCPCLCQSQSTWNPQTKDLARQLRPFTRGPQLWKAHFAWAGRLAEAFSWVMCLELDRPAEVSAMAQTSESMEICADSTPHP